jgi:hypothetical protein
MARSQVLVHIGYPKAGSTWLQKNLFYHYDRGFFPLTDKNVLPGRCEFLYSHFVYDHGKAYSPQGRQLLSPFEFEPQRIRDLVSRLDWDHAGVPVFSSERLTGIPFSSGFDARHIADRLRAVFPDCKILIVFREQAAMIRSVYFEYLKMGGAHSLPRYIRQSYDSFVPLFSFNYFEYHYLISYYQSLFGKHNVLAMPFELFVRDPTDFLNRLAEFSGARIAFDRLDFQRAENPAENRWVASATRKLSLLSRASSANGYSPLCNRYAGRAVDALRRTLARLVSSQREAEFGQRMLAEVRSTVGSHYEASNLQTAELTGFDLSKFGYVVAASATATLAAPAVALAAGVA